MKNALVGAAWLLLGVVLTKLTGFGREAMLAAVYGVSGIVDAYNIALVIPSLLFTVLSTAISTVLVPTLIQVETEEGAREYCRSAWLFFHIILVLSSALSCLAILAASFLVRLVGPGLSQEDSVVATQLLQWMIPLAIFQSLSAWATAVLHTRGQFAITGITNMPNNIILIACIFISQFYGGIHLVAIGTTIGALSTFLVQLPGLTRIGLRYQCVLNLQHPIVRQVAFLLPPVLVSAGAAQANTVIDRVLASGLAAGSIAIISYAQRAYGLVTGFLELPVVTALYPTLAEAEAKGDRGKFIKIIEEGLGILWFLLIPSAAAVLFLRVPITQFLYERGAFDARATGLTSAVLACYALGIPFVGMRDLLVRCYYSLHDSSTPMWNSVLMLVVNVGLSLVLVRPLGPMGLALGNSAASIAGSVFLLISLRNHLRNSSLLQSETLNLRYLATAFMRSVSASVIMVIFLGTASHHVGEPTGFLARGLRLLVLIGIGGVAYFVTQVIFGSPEASLFVRLASRFFRRYVPGSKGM